MPAKLKRCPFCGGHAERRSILEWSVDEDGYEYEANRYYVACSNRYYVACSFCGNRTPFYDKPKKARKAWNRRLTV